MKRPKIGIFKKYEVDNNEHYRWYGANYNPEKHKKQRPKIPILDLEVLQDIKTEKQLLLIIREYWGIGKYIIRSYTGGRGKAFSTFWQGEITEEGFKFWKNRANTKEVNYWKKEQIKAEGDAEEKEMIKDFIADSKKEAVEERKRRRYGFYPYLKPSGKRGYFNRWNDEDVKFKEEDWGLNKQSQKAQLENWGNPRKQEFEKW